MSAALAIYRAATGLAEPFAPALLRQRSRRGKEDPARMGERLGRASLPRPKGALAWLHGASVGEALSLLPLVERLRRARPSLNVLVTSGTTTSAELLALRLPAGVTHQYAPIDTPGAARRFLEAWRPDLAVFVESELWPNLLTQARTRGVRLAALSARMSETSARNWRRLSGAARELFKGFDLVMPQDDLAAARLSGLGARDDGRLNLKLAGDPLPADARIAPAMKAIGSRPVLLAASTHPGEEEIALEAFQGIASDRPDLDVALVIVPRHPIRGRGVADRAREMGFSTVLQSELGAAKDAARAEVWVADALGELGAWFRLANSAFVGGSLAPGIGGHNPLEPARLDCPIVTGPHVENWASVYAMLREADALVEVNGAESLDRAWRTDVERYREARARGRRGHQAAEAGAGDLDRAVERLLELVP